MFNNRGHPVSTVLALCEQSVGSLAARLLAVSDHPSSLRERWSHASRSQNPTSPASSQRSRTDSSRIILETDAAAIAGRVTRPKPDTTDIVINEQTLLNACEWPPGDKLHARQFGFVLTRIPQTPLSRSASLSASTSSRRHHCRKHGVRRRTVGGRVVKIQDEDDMIQVVLMRERGLRRNMVLTFLGNALAAGLHSDGDGKGAWPGKLGKLGKLGKGES